MKRFMLSLVAAASLFAGGSLFAQEAVVEAKVPFDFVVANSSLPAGTYRIGACPSPLATQVTTVRNCDTGQAVFNQSIPEHGQAQYPGKLVFYKYGDLYFLKEVHGPWAGTNVSVPESRREKAARLEYATVRTWEEIIVPNEKQ